MKSLNFDSGVKEYEINGDPNRVLRINPSDFGIIERINKAKDALDELHITPDIDGMVELDKAVRAQIDEIFGAGSSDTIFGETNSASFASGQPVFLNFLECITPEIARVIEEEKKKSATKIKKYTSQVENLK